MVRARIVIMAKTTVYHHRNGRSYPKPLICNHWILSIAPKGHTFIAPFHRRRNGRPGSHSRKQQSYNLNVLDEALNPECPSIPSAPIKWCPSRRKCMGASSKVGTMTIKHFCPCKACTIVLRKEVRSAKSHASVLIFQGSPATLAGTYFRREICSCTPPPRRRMKSTKQGGPNLLSYRFINSYMEESCVLLI